jgi:ABC-type bacteriocin/lantibiotic exporter with double-glycine peptidase domain
MNQAPRASFLILLLGLVGFGLGGCQLSYTGGARVVTPAQLDGGWLRAAPTPVVRQTAEADCGLAALAMIAGAWGQTWTVAELLETARPTDKGIKLGVLRDLARARGLDAYAIAGTHADIERELAKGRPVMIGVLLPFERDRARSHYEVVVALDPRDGTVVTLDPASGRYLKRSKQVLETEWKPAQHATLVVVGTRPPAPSGNAQAAVTPRRAAVIPPAR